MEPLQLLFIAVMGFALFAILGDELNSIVRMLPWSFLSFVLGVGSIILGLSNLNPSQPLTGAGLVGLASPTVGVLNFISGDAQPPGLVVVGVVFVIIGVSLYLIKKYK